MNDKKVPISKTISHWLILAATFILLVVISACVKPSVTPSETPSEIPSETPSETPEILEEVDANPNLQETSIVKTEEDREAAVDNVYCAGLDEHPIGESISQTYDVTYEEVMRLYCSGYMFDNILLAFATSHQTDDDYSPRELLHLRLTLTWEEIWDEVGVLENE